MDYRSYAPAITWIAAQGYLVVLVPAPLNLMVFDIDAAGTIFPQFPQIHIGLWVDTRWAERWLPVTCIRTLA